MCRGFNSLPGHQQNQWVMGNQGIAHFHFCVPIVCQAAIAQVSRTTDHRSICNSGSRSEITNACQEVSEDSMTQDRNTQEPLFPDLDFEVMNEAAVREEIVAPLMRVLGFRSGTANNIIRELKLVYPRIQFRTLAQWRSSELRRCSGLAGTFTTSHRIDET